MFINFKYMFVNLYIMFIKFVNLIKCLSIFILCFSNKYTQIDKLKLKIDKLDYFAKIFKERDIF